MYVIIYNNTSEPIKVVINRGLMSKNAKYTPAIRSFALTLQFYSAKEYSFVRKMFKNLMPHPATLKKIENQDLHVKPLLQ
ncbi:THAP-type domain-containing protein [Aphis craccivora]|uniref:THAP-type domain-containing protein n=1 Tax=Aphis craccivora TaxID=307492 RepID=A0A6G0YQ48_APHCR|nr:THAP-type domain-containing protein [Aphis craccivora]